jgi:hypothetical protein
LVPFQEKEKNNESILWVFVLLETSHPLSLKLRNFLLLSAFVIDWALCSLDSIDAIGSRYYDGKTMASA